ncbi:MAG: NTP transferase domain-containing protein, partial [Gemmatimonadaceae bacterium]
MPELQFAAIVPARGGSTRVPRKNLALLGGRRLLDYTLDACCDAGLSGLIFVSTDDDEIATMAAGRPGIRVIHRPAELATATASTESVLLHALDILDREDVSPDWILTLPPTSPFRTAATIRAFIDAVTAAPHDQD